MIDYFILTHMIMIIVTIHNIYLSVYCHYIYVYIERGQKERDREREKESGILPKTLQTLLELQGS